MGHGARAHGECACHCPDVSSLHILTCMGAQRCPPSCRPEPGTAGDTSDRQGRCWQGRARRTRERSRWARAPSRPALAPPCTLVQVAGKSVSSRRPGPAEGCPSPLQRILYYSFLAAWRWQSCGAASLRSHQEAALTRVISPYPKLLTAPGLPAQCVVVWDTQKSPALQAKDS